MKYVVVLLLVFTRSIVQAANYDPTLFILE